MGRSVLIVYKALLFIAAIMLVCVAIAQANVFSPQEILERSDVVRQFGISYATTATITSIKSGGIQSINKYEVLAKDNGNKMLVNFIFPKMEIGKRILMVGREMWIFLPDVGKPLKIPPSQRLIGDIAYGDIARLNYATDYNATLVRTEVYEGKECFVLFLRAKDDTVTYGAVTYWIATENFHPLRAEFYTMQRKLIKTGLFDNYQFINGHLRPTKITMIDELRNTQSILEYNDVTQKEIQDKFFDKNYLGRLK